MAVVDDLGCPGVEAPSEDYGRQPPQDLAAEQSVLGGMLLSKDAIADVLERLRPSDFYRPAHQNVYDAILDLYGRGEPADTPHGRLPGRRLRRCDVLCHRKTFQFSVACATGACVRTILGVRSGAVNKRIPAPG